MRIKLIILISFLLSSVFILNSCVKYKKKTVPKKIEIKKSFYSMGTFWEIKVISTVKNRKKDLKAINLAIKRVKKLDDILSDFKPSSNVSVINKYSGIKPVRANPYTLSLLKMSLKFYGLTENSFNAAIGPVMKIWGFYDKKYTVPSKAEIKKALFLSNISFIKINKNTVFLKRKGMMLDFGGDGEGYGIDEALFVLKKYGIKNAMINGGGQITAIGKNLKGKGWKIGLLNPLNKDKIIKIIRLKNESVETSANYENRFSHKGKYYGHIMDPNTGYPVDGNTLSDTVIVQNRYFRYPSTVADALSCSFFILDKNQITAVIKKINMPVKVIIIKRAGGKSGLKTLYIQPITR